MTETVPKTTVLNVMIVAKLQMLEVSLVTTKVYTICMGMLGNGVWIIMPLIKNAY